MQRRKDRAANYWSEKRGSSFRNTCTDESEVAVWLKQCGLARYCATFARSGLQYLAQLRAVDADFLAKMSLRR